MRRTDRSQAFYGGARNPNVKALRRILLTYSMYNFDLGYCQVRAWALLPGFEPPSRTFLFCNAHCNELTYSMFGFDLGFSQSLAGSNSLNPKP